MAKENQNHPNFPTRPLGPPVSAHHGVTPFAPSGPGEMLISNASKPPAPSTSSQMTIPFPPSVPLVRQHDSSYRPFQPGGIPSMPPPPTYSIVRPRPRPRPPSLVPVLPTPWSSTVEQTVIHPSGRPPTGLYTTSMFSRESQGTLRQNQSQPQSIKPSPQTNDTLSYSVVDSVVSSASSLFQYFKPSSPPVDSIYSASAASLHPKFPPFHRVPGNALAQSEPASLPATSFAYQPGCDSPSSAAAVPFLAMRRGYIQPPPISAPPGAYTKDKMQQSDWVDPAVDSIIDDFNFLSIVYAPGSSDSGVDIKTLPRPLEDDMEPNSFAEMYPMNCHMRYLRLTTYAMPNSKALLSRWHLPLGAVFCPLAEGPHGETVPVVNLGLTNIIRCVMCRAIVNPYVTFTDCGRNWQCNICGCRNDVPDHYIASLDDNGKRADLAEWPELINGSVEYVAFRDCMVQPSNAPVYFFLIDVSKNGVERGMLKVVADAITSCLDRLANYPGTQIGFITFDSRIHFYDMTKSFMRPRMVVVSDIDDIFVPVPHGLLVNLSESRALVDEFLYCLPIMFEHTSEVESAFGPAVQAANMVMSKIGGKLLIFLSTLPSLGVGKLCLRSDFHHSDGTDQEHLVRYPADPFYAQMAAELTKRQIPVDIYVFSDKYGDTATLGTLASYTGGQVYYYPNFKSASHKECLKNDLIRDLTRETAWDALLRIRCGKGLQIASIQGNLMFGKTDLLSLGAIDCDKAYTAEFCLDEMFPTPQEIYFQVSLESPSGERRTRVHTAAAPVVSNLIEMYKHADTGAIISLCSRLAMEKTLSGNVEDARIMIQQWIVKALREYQSLLPSEHRQGGKMHYPESLKYLPLYGLSLSKSTPLRLGYGNSLLDERGVQTNAMRGLPVNRLLNLLYPSFFRIDEYLLNASLNVDEFRKTCKRLPLSAQSIDDRGLYIYDNGFKFVIFFGRNLLPDVATNLLGKEPVADSSKVRTCVHDNGMKRKLMSILDKLREDNPSCYQLPYFIRQGDYPGDVIFLSSLIEDPTDGPHGYAGWIFKIFQHLQ